MIRVAQPEDIDALTHLEKELFRSARWSRNMIEAEMKGPDRLYLVWENDEGIVCGYAGLWYGAPDAEIMTIGVAYGYQGQGIGRKLLTRLLDEGQKHGNSRILLEVRVDNAPAIHLYHSVGFRDMGYRKGYYQPENIDALTMSYDVISHC